MRWKIDVDLARAVTKMMLSKFAVHDRSALVILHHLEPCAEREPNRVGRNRHCYDTAMPQNASEQKQGTADRVDQTLARHGALSYIEIPAIDVRRSAGFYENVLGWQINGDDPDHPKFMDQTRHLLGRWVTGRPISRDPGLLPFFYVNRIADAVTSVISHDGEVIKHPHHEGNLWISIIRDPAGNMIGLWQERESDVG
jgi:predicted enzyme related to lactoylglutathione lyase